MRNYIRHAIDMSIQAMTFYTRSNSAATRRELKDICEGGLCFKSATPMELGTLLHVRIPVLKPPFEVEARVTRCSGELGDYEIAVAFEQKPVDDLLRMVGQACNIKRYSRLQREKGRVLSTDEAARELINEAGGFEVERVA